MKPNPWLVQKESEFVPGFRDRIEEERVGGANRLYGFGLEFHEAGVWKNFCGLELFFWTNQIILKKIKEERKKNNAKVMQTLI